MQKAVVKQDADTAQVFVGRQPILDRNLKTCAYELLFRPGMQHEATFPDGDCATAQVIHNTLMEVGLHDLVGRHTAFINFTRSTLLGDFARLLPNDQVVLEILEDVEIDDELILGVKTLAAEGYVFALDDYKHEPEWEPLLALASIIKYDITVTPMETISNELDYIRHHDVKLLAEKVETKEEYEFFRDLGFDYFQGYFFAKPTIIQRDKLPDSQSALVRLLGRLQDPSIDMKEAELLVSHNVSLSFKILRYINSAAFSFTRKIDSIHQAITYFGLKQLKNWACVMAMTEIDNKPSELMRVGLARARMCELIAEQTGRKDGDSYFMVGLFSVLNVLMDCSMSQILDQLSVSDKVETALLYRDGEIGAALTCSVACESGRLNELDAGLLDISTIGRLHLDSLIWADQVMS